MSLRSRLRGGTWDWRHPPRQGAMVGRTVTGGVWLVLCMVLQTGVLGYDDPYIRDAVEAPQVSAYDYIVVGGGAAGCPLAATLSEQYSVLVLERGGVPYDQPSVYRLEGFPWVLTTPAAQSFRSVEGVSNRRGHVLGGGSSVNAGFYSRADTGFLQQTGWDLDAVNSAYEWVESQIVFDPPVGRWQTALAQGLLEAGVAPWNNRSLEHLIGSKIGNTIFDSNGTRHSSADLLRSGSSVNLDVYVFAVVQRILFDTLEDGQPNAIGVIFTDKNGTTKVAVLKSGGEVLLAAGALGSPQLLMLSGIGPIDELAKHNIPLVLEKPMIGQSITDVPINGFVVSSPSAVELSSLTVVGISEYGNIIEGASGGNSSTVWEQAGLDVTNPPALRSDSRASMLATILPVLPPSWINLMNQGAFILSKVFRPTSRGTLTLNNTDITQNPIVRYNYYSTQEDIDVCVNGSRILNKLVNSTAFSDFRYTSVPAPLRVIFPQLAAVQDGQFVGTYPLLPDPENYTAAAQWCKDTVGVIWHFHGGCQRGDCVDEEYRLVGAQSLRVIDGSTWLTSPGTNPQATVMMLGRYQGQRILAGRQAPS